jgi:multicomponent Na+:H+ antiporter subunit E
MRLGVWFRAATRVIAFAGLWWLLTGGRPDSWVVGAFAIAAAVLASRALASGRTTRWRAAAVPGFVWYFLRESLRSGLAVARLAVAPRSSLDPELLDVRLRLPDGAPRVLLANVVSLLPGSLSVRLMGDRLLVHAIANADAARADIEALEARVALLLRSPAPVAEGATRG